MSAPELNQVSPPASRAALTALRAELATLRAQSEVGGALLALQQDEPDVAQAHVRRAAKTLRAAAALADTDEAVSYRGALKVIERADADTAAADPALRARLQKLDRQLEVLSAGGAQSASFGPSSY
jgi:hypothetical protein